MVHKVSRTLKKKPAEALPLAFTGKAKEPLEANLYKHLPHVKNRSFSQCARFFLGFDVGSIFRQLE